MDLSLSGKIIMVAAASKGLGFGIAQACAREGATVCIGSRTKASIDKAAGDLRSDTGADVSAFVLDAADAASIAAWTAAVQRQHGRIDGLVVNAGGPRPGYFDDLDDSDWEAAFNLTLMSAVRMIRGVLPSMRSNGSGAILTVTSTSVKEPIDILLLSNVMRSGVTSLVKSLSIMVASEGIRVNNIVPGRIDTDRVRGLDEKYAATHGVSPQEARERLQATIPLGRYGTIDEFGRAGAFLLSDAASYITGATILVDGGKTRTVW